MSYYGLLQRDECMKKSQFDPDTNPDVGWMNGINKSQLFIAGADALSEVHLENALSPSVNILVDILPPYPIDVPGKVWSVFDGLRLEAAIHRVYLEDNGLLPAEEPQQSPDCPVDVGPNLPEKSVAVPSTSKGSPMRNLRKRAAKAKKPSHRTWGVKKTRPRSNPAKKLSRKTFGAEQMKPCSRKYGRHPNPQALSAALLKLRESGGDVMAKPIPAWRCRFCTNNCPDESACRAHEAVCDNNLVPSTTTLWLVGLIYPMMVLLGYVTFASSPFVPVKS
ncbi:hypothetical protein QAD02_018627 [Eretmocerus hayati]|uniref:Uncharacterized protein n=1 Tax=Eretmocerus hayati TaxID=131215 RepID=A0ACC2PHE3_9HYME|nr:hypothetical protein QAD02_018627 [Eretmocerus hayati]